MLSMLIAGPTRARATKDRFATLSRPHIRIEASAAFFTVLIALTLLAFLLLSLLFCVEAIVEIKLIALCHGSLVLLSQFDAQLFSYSEQQLFSELEEMLLFELLDIIGAFHLKGEAT